MYCKFKYEYYKLKDLKIRCYNFTVKKKKNIF